jgi:hypothetical protein
MVEIVMKRINNLTGVFSKQHAITGVQKWSSTQKLYNIFSRVSEQKPKATPYRKNDVSTCIDTESKLAKKIKM